MPGQATLCSNRSLVPELHEDGHENIGSDLAGCGHDAAAAEVAKMVPDGRHIMHDIYIGYAKSVPQP